MSTDPDTKSAAISGGKKRALEALERRFAAKPTEIISPHPQETKRIKKLPKITRKAELDTRPAPRKVRPANAGYTPSREASGIHPAYSELSLAVHENLIPASSETTSNKETTTSNKETVNKVVNNLLQSGDNAQKYIRGSRSMKIDNWLLLDNFVPRDKASTDARVKGLQNHSKRSRRHMSMRQHRKCGSFEFPKEFHKFDLFKPMHDLWKEYMNELLQQTEKRKLPQTLLAADLHGAYFQVVECKMTDLKGASGIMVRETTETFGIVTQDNRFRVVPKQGSVFILQADCLKITLHGDKLSLRTTGT